MDTQTITLEREIKSPARQVYRALTNSTALREWFCDVATTHIKIGGHFYAAWNEGFYTCGEFIALEPDTHIAFTWLGSTDPGKTEVHIDLASKGNNTILSLEHRGLGLGETWDKIREIFKKEWESGLENLVSVLETGEDIRFTKRPMLGIVVGEFDAEIAKKLGVPVNAGIHLSDVITNMGSYAAGLRAGDVLISLDDKPISDWPGLTNALFHRRAGEEVAIAFYRRNELKKATLKLSGRPIPLIPFNINDLLAMVRQKNSPIYAEIENLLDGINDEEAKFKPTEDEWSIAEILAHLIHSEHYSHNWIASLVVCQEASYDDLSGNLQARIMATLRTYADFKSLVTEWKYSANETMSLIELLPDDFVMQKASYWRMGYSLLEGNPSHLQSHLEQMKNNLEVARRK